MATPDEAATLQWAQGICPEVKKIEDLSDGVAFVHLIEVLASVNLKCKEEPKRFKDKLRNAKTAIKTANAFGLECDVTPEDIVSGDHDQMFKFLCELEGFSASFRSRSASSLARYSRTYDNESYEAVQIVLCQALIRRYLAHRELIRERKREVHRDQVAREIYSSEEVYVYALEALCQYKDQLEFNLKVSPEPLMTREQINDVFLNCSEIFNYNKVVLDELKERMDQWSRTQKLGDIFIRMAPYLKLYQFYCNAYDKAADLCNELRKRPVMEAFLAGVLAQSGTDTALPLDALLIMPVQRVPRYILLLKDLIRHTNVEHSDYEDLCDGLHRIQATANTVNNSIRQAEMMNKVYSIQQQITGPDAPVLLEPGRYYVYEGPMKIVQLDSKKGKKEFVSCHFYLFNDALVYVTEKGHQFRGMLNFNAYMVRVKDIPDSGVVSDAFMLVSPEKTVTLACASVEDKIEWMSKISNMLAGTLQAQYSRSVEEEDEEGLMSGLSATIIGTEMRQDKSKNKFTVYNIQVTSRKRTYTVCHRYSEFDTLYNKIKKKFPQHKFQPLPKKHFLGNLGSNVVESRQVMLETFLEDVLMKPDVCNSSEFVIFLQPSDNYQSVTAIKKDKRKMKLLKEEKRKRSSELITKVTLPPGMTVKRSSGSDHPSHAPNASKTKEPSGASSRPEGAESSAKPLPTPPAEPPAPQTTGPPPRRPGSRPSSAGSPVGSPSQLKKRVGKLPPPPRPMSAMPAASVEPPSNGKALPRPAVGALPPPVPDDDDEPPPRPTTLPPPLDQTIPPPLTPGVPPPLSGVKSPRATELLESCPIPPPLETAVSPRQ